MSIREIMKISCWFFLLTTLISCNPTPPPPQFHSHIIKGRESTAPLYRVNTPTDWQCSLPEAGPKDTTLPLCEFFIADKIRISIHNFPNQNLENRIPPQAQVERWKKQFKQLSPLNYHIQEESWGGYLGLYLQATGLLNGEETKMLAWSLQLSEKHFLNCMDDPAYQQALADFTIKVVGPKDVVEANQSEIEKFAHSFELIDELPQST